MTLISKLESDQRPRVSRQSTRNSGFESFRSKKNILTKKWLHGFLFVWFGFWFLLLLLFCLCVCLFVCFLLLLLFFVCLWLCVFCLFVCFCFFRGCFFGVVVVDVVVVGGGSVFVFFCTAERQKLISPVLSNSKQNKNSFLFTSCSLGPSPVKNVCWPHWTLLFPPHTCLSDLVLNKNIVFSCKHIIRT